MRLHPQAGILLGAVAALTACGNTGQEASPSGMPSVANSVSAAASSPVTPPSTTAPGRQAPAGTARIASCKVAGKTVSVTGTVTNATDKTKAFVIAVEVRQGDKAVAGVPLLMTGVAPKATATASNTTVLKGAADSVTCVVKNVGDVG